MTNASVPTDECACFQNSVKSFLKRQKKRLEKKHGSLLMPTATAPYDRSVQDAMSITHHAIHVLKTLYIKKDSLSNAIKIFDKVCRDSIELVKQVPVPVYNSDINTCVLQTTLQEILTHLFVQYIRIRDGFVLLTSGECRHKGDSTLANSEKRFPSRLTALTKRKDGYTALFSSNCGYSGYGWDEFHNEEVGIRRRLLDALRKCCIYPKKMNAETEEKFLEGGTASASRENVWEKLIESGAELFESSFDSHENHMKELQRYLERNRAGFIDDMERVLAAHGGGRLIMITEDKFERLELKINSIGLSAFCIQRQGDAFRGKDSRGALPSNCTLGDWAKIMGIPDNLKNLKSKIGLRVTTKPLSKGGGSKRKRVVIAESDEEDIDYGDAKNSLKVTVKRAPQKETSSGSIHSIKKQLGVNVDELERGREEIEAEEKCTKEAAFVDEVGEMFKKSSWNNASAIAYSEEIAELNESILDEEENVNMLRSVCKRKKKDYDEAWDARESLRFSLMSLGILLLDYHSLTQNNQDYSILKKAEPYFQESIKIIKELVQMNKPDIDGEREEFEFRQISLLLCSGRAYTNLGKTYFEQSEMILGRKNDFGGDQREQYSKLALAIKCFRNAEKDAIALRSKSVTKKLDKRAELHVFDANSLLSMTWRFQGHAFLRLLKEEICIGKLRKAAGLSDFNATTIHVEPKVNSEVDEIEAKVSLILEQYDGACSLISISSSLSNRALQGTTNESWDEDVSKTLREAYDQATNLSEALEEFSHSSIAVKEMISQHDIRSSTEIKRLKDEAMKHNQQKKTADSKLSSQSAMNHSTTPSLPRNDLFRNASLSRSDTSGRIVIDSSARKKRDEFEEKKQSHKRKSETDDAFDGFGLHTNEDDEGPSFEEISLPRVQHRKWGDEIFEDQEMNADSYPSCEPERPAEMINELQCLGIEQ